ncbi:TetR/AcrR family transcriptional regulator [Streptomyces chitinivorans]|uniref:TetR/AcrR family transcriptional regulator n=1 Tax=Streptomyces chitinivorans TaxID=1257027 RepID=A0ABW7HRV9_9ACTN|nr:TetR/AcrR family transcriptional regulator [Streptomyces chitinivorans]MDH2409069.1 TetR/AcrR family transcriptional regulator [Streptomyces chitinivorans]
MTADPARSRVRLSAEDRRGQLIGIGLRLLVSRPIHELSVHEVAAEAGISRGLLFHYFPTKRDYYVAVVRAAGQRLLRHTRLPDEGGPEERVRAVVAGFTGFVRRRRANYVSLVRAGAGGDELVVEVFEGIRAALAERILTALGEPSPDPLIRLAVRGWLAMAEEMAIEAGEEVATEELVGFLVEGLGRLLAPLGAPLAPSR